MSEPAGDGPDRAPAGFFCRSPFEYVHIQANGDVYPCCPSKFGRIIGNLKTSTLEEVWSSPAAREVRDSIVDGSYKFCNAAACEYLRDASARGQALSPLPLVRWAADRGMLESGALPTVANFGFDRSCNLECGYCRKELFRPTASQLDTIGAIDANIFNSRLDGLERIILLGEGDPFASVHYREKLRHYDWGRHPRLKIKIQSNGLLLTPAMWSSIERSHSAIDWISISVDAASPETYRLNRGGNYAVVLRNLDFVANLRALGHIEKFFINFLVLANNFHEMPAFARIGRRLGCDLIEFQRLENWGTYCEEEYRARAVHEPFHPQHADFVRVLDDPALADDRVWLLKLTARPQETAAIGVMSCKGID
jgi:radical SAM protein with 4Fe4S-binding SPASM domain